MKDKLILYFQTFSNKDLQGLYDMFSFDVTLTDWEISAVGREEVIAANKKIFDSVDTISVKPIEFFECDNSYAVKILVVVNRTELIEVVDIISFNEEGLIESIEAYKK
jgi:hypothetical protein